MKPPGETRPTHTSIPVSWSPEKAERKSVLLPVTKFTVICCSGSPLGATPGLFPAEAVAFTLQDQWSRGGEAGDLGSKMGRGDEGRGEGGHLGQARAERPAGEEAAGRHCLLESPLG